MPRFLLSVPEWLLRGQTLFLLFVGAARVHAVSCALGGLQAGAPPASDSVKGSCVGMGLCLSEAPPPISSCAAPRCDPARCGCLTTTSSSLIVCAHSLSLSAGGSRGHAESENFGSVRQHPVAPLPPIAPNCQGPSRRSWATCPSYRPSSWLAINSRVRRG